MAAFIFYRKYSIKTGSYALLMGLFLLISACQAPHPQPSSRDITPVSTPAFTLAITKVAPNVYSAIGATQPPSYENRGHNNNLSFIVTSEGVLVVNGGDNYLLAQALHRAIQQVTKQPVRWVVDENGQGHAFLGNSYWASQDIPTIALEPACEEIRERGEVSLNSMLQRNRERGAHTFVSVPRICFDGSLHLNLGGTPIEIITFGPAHSTGDLSVWLPKQKILIAGDIAFHQRLLAIFPDTQVAEWLKSFTRMAALKPDIIVPGHGVPTDLATITTYTYDYLVYLTEQVNRILEQDGDLSDAYEIDQSAYSHLDTFTELARKNAGRLYQQMEMDSF